MQTNIFKTMPRICITPKDIMLISGISERQARNIMKKIKEVHNKQPHQRVTLTELCQYFGINPEEVIKTIK